MKKENGKTGGIPGRKRWIFAACAAVAVLGGFLIFRAVQPDEPGRQVAIGGIAREYRNLDVSTTESSREWPWEQKTVFEQYQTVNYNGRAYTIRTDKLELSDPSLLGAELGTCEGIGYETTFDPETKTWNDFEYRRTFGARQICGVSEDRMIAVDLDGRYYVYRYQEYDPPADLGEFLDLYSLPQTLELNRYTVYEKGRETGYYRIEDDAYIWEVLDTCRDAVSVGDWDTIEKDYFSFTVTSEALGVYKHVLYISEDGYLSTNAMDWRYAYSIGTEAAGRILSYAAEHAVETDFEPYTESLTGMVTEIGEGYILVDDSILCADRKDGIAFKVLTDDPRVQRWVDSGSVEIGDLVWVQFIGEIVPGKDHAVAGAFALTEAHLADGEVYILE